MAERLPAPPGNERAGRPRARRAVPQPTAFAFEPAPVAFLDRPLDGTRISRSLPADASRPRPGTKIRPGGGDGTIRRAITDQDWNAEVAPRMGGGKSVTVWVGDEALVLRTQGNQLQEYNTWTQDWSDVDAGRLLEIKRDAERLPAHLRAAPSYDAVDQPSDDGFTVSDFAGERLSLVHHTKMDKAEDSHLTIENAHVLAFTEMFGGDGPRDARDKTKEDKRTINEKLDASGFGGVDNVNFYAPAKGNAKSKSSEPGGSLAGLTLDQYVRFIAHALDQGGAPPEYGDRILGYAAEMSKQSKLDMTDLLMRSGKGDEKAFIRAVFIIESQVPGFALNIAQGWRDVFKKWWKVGDNEGKVAFLPENSAPGKFTVKQPESFIRSGDVASSGDSYSVLEGLYCEEAFKNVSKAVTDKMANVPVRAIPQVPPKAKVAVGSGAKVATTNTPKTGPTPSKVDAKPTANATKGKAANTTTNNQKASNPSGGKTPVNKTPPKKSDKKPK